MAAEDPRSHTVIAHISDLEFGAEDPTVVAGLARDVAASRPDLVAVSGDVTHRARLRQFQAASVFLRSLPGPVLAIPGNHDLPLINLGRRAVSPLGRFRRYVAEDLNPFIEVGNVAVLGLNTARASAIKGGRVSREQMEVIHRRFADLDGRFKILVTHHPFALPPVHPHSDTVGRGGRAIEAAESAGVDLVLSGHLHVDWAADARARVEKLPGSILVIEAGTACSVRTRGARNSYNLIEVGPDLAEVTLEVRVWNGSQFTAGPVRRFTRKPSGWSG